MNIIKTIQTSIPFLSETWKEQYAPFLEEEALYTFAKALHIYTQQGIPKEYGLPYFKEEVTPDPEFVLKHFKPLFQATDTTPEQWAKAIEATPFEHLLVIMGQRWTSASIKDIHALPPSEKTLLESCFAPYNDQITMVTRAWEKHMGRSSDAFWGIAKGNPTQKEETIKKQITEMIQTQTWWNIFYHYKHELVYEIRVPSGHGIRWNKEGTQLIGFLEPFL
ncbi:hypothetical protein GCM10011344_25410 [Dokdonia pacifica]|uniref:Uncharacterized protein n=1 Tax=Dokdonia pacifica TaxID=1627892 RepID=A0A238WRA0_9FLAO|nr:hypothetical protein [Dokdonia pacifica]GGG23572.1 hypothetical protein GCM10011344_25410 [Dokdonia pacifica]SNR49130.1 hypothetical protein SAMN06265376_1011398 [Dokdonia pacifica]